jgi:hypothetical protein
MTSTTIAFVVAQITMLFAAAHFHDGTHWRGCVFYGVIAAQFAMVGVWLGVGDRPLLQRWATGLLFGILLAAVAITRPNFNPWELMLASVRVIALGVVFGLIRRKRKLIVRRTDRHTEVRLLQLSLMHLFVLMFGSAAFLALMRWLESYGGGLYDVLLVVTMVILGLAASLVSVMASAAALSNSDVTTITATTFAILVVAGGLAWVAYAQTDSAETAAQWFAACILEALLVATSLLAFRLRGYQLVREAFAVA